MTISKAESTWTGSLKGGNGTVKSGNGMFQAPFTFASRFEGKSDATTPEELIGAAHAGCFSMFLAAQLEKAGHVATRVHTTATVHLEAGPTVTKIVLHTVASAPGASLELFNEKVAFSKANCPISKALAAVPEIVVNAKLE